ncbi:MAG: hypothetical protein J0H78_19050 [Rhizobiales bacterium]|nr:hypothetical protein [Hyphomicrobiales bacterium]OJY44286.1 MAG: hypothetical protein BGP08_08795 [Rhizobiales bacterium 64-17]
MKEHGPEYNVTSPALVRFRKLANGRTLTREERQAYGAAVEAAVLAAQRRQLRSAAEPEHRPNCASRSWPNKPGEVGEVIRRQQRAALARCAEQERRARTPDQWEKMYREAMPEGFVPSWEREAAAEREAMAEAQAIAERVMAGGPIFPEPIAEKALPCAA